MSLENESGSNCDGFRERIIEYKKLPKCKYTPPKYSYIHYKAWLYLKLGVAEYQRTDYFGIPDSTFDYEEIKIGCEQIMKCAGYDKKKPFQLSIGNMNDLMAIFHFRMINQKADFVSSEHILDSLIFEHVIDKSQIILFNLVHQKKY